MIDFSTLKTIEEKLLVLFLSLSNSSTFKKIIKTLAINESGCRRTLKKLVDNKIINKFENGFDITEYQISVQDHDTEYRKHRPLSKKLAATLPRFLKKWKPCNKKAASPCISGSITDTGKRCKFRKLGFLNRFSVNPP